MDLSGSGFIHYRGLIFELYILKKLTEGNFEIQYEVNRGGNSGQIDFLAVKDGIELLVEVTSVGPNEYGLHNPKYDIDPEGYKKLRNAFKNKLHKVHTAPGTPTLLALCDSNELFMNTKFKKVQTLYGTPAVRFNFQTEQSTLVLSDKGIWAEHVHEARGYSGVYFTQGTYPGFTRLQLPEIWLNPMAEHALEVEIWPEDVIYFKSSKELFTTSKSKDFVWQKVDSIFD